MGIPILLGRQEFIRISDEFNSKQEGCLRNSKTPLLLTTIWWRGMDLNHGPSGYEPDELPDCSTPRRLRFASLV